MVNNNKNVSYTVFDRWKRFYKVIRSFDGGAVYIVHFEHITSFIYLYNEHFELIALKGGRILPLKIYAVAAKVRIFTKLGFSVNDKTRLI